MIRPTANTETVEYSDTGSGDREKVTVCVKRMCLHIGRTHAAFYVVLEDEEQVCVVGITTIDEAHERYGF